MTRLPGGPVAAAMALVALTSLLSGCKEAEVASYSSGYEPSHLEQVADSELHAVTFTKIGAEQVDLTTVPATQVGGQTVVPYAALIYDGQGVPHVYTAPEDLTFLRTQVTVDRIEGDSVLLRNGVDPGTKVVTVGAAEVWGAELEIAGGH